MNKIGSLFRHLNNDRQFNIITFPTHERYEKQLCKTGHNFFAANLPNFKSWSANHTLPDNYFILPKEDFLNIRYDLILVHSRFNQQLQMAQNLRNLFNVPILVLDHSQPQPNLPPKIKEYTKTLSGDVNVFITEFSKDLWDINSPYNFVVRHGIDCDLFKPIDIQKENYILAVANNIAQRSDLYYEDFLEMVNGFDYKIVGDNPGISESVKNDEELVTEYNKCGLYINTGRTPIPMSLLEAMACGCAVISCAYSIIPEIIKNGENGFVTDDISEVRNYAKEILNNPSLRDKLGKAARETVLSEFSEDKFVSKWNNTFNMIYEGTIK